MNGRIKFLIIVVIIIFIFITGCINSQNNEASEKPVTIYPSWTPDKSFPPIHTPVTPLLPPTPTIIPDIDK
jgi:hypothetical protein